MSHSLKTNTRNLSLECCKLVASCFVVFLHIPFPGQFGEAVVCLSRFAVPLFFAVSGWFSYGASPKKLSKRLFHILLLELLGAGIYVLWRCTLGCYHGESLYWSLLPQLPDAQAVKLWLLWSVDPFAGHLWYLSATALSYAALWLYTRITKGSKGYLPLYSSGLLLLAACFAMSEFSRFTGIKVDYRVYRSGIFLGFPIFCLGLFLRQYREQLHRLGLPLLIGGITLSILEWKTFGGYDLYIGSVLTAAAVLLLTDRHPDVPRWLEGSAAGFGTVSTSVYLLHLLWQEVYIQFFLGKAEALGTWEPWLQPVLILAVSLAAGFLWRVVAKLLKKE